MIAPSPYATWVARFYATLGLHQRAKRADELAEESELILAEHKAVWGKAPQRIEFDEIIAELATGKPGRFMDRKIQAYISAELWPPQSPTNFDEVEARGVDNAWSRSVEAVRMLLMLSHPNVLYTMTVRFNPCVASSEIDGERVDTYGTTPAMAMMAAHVTASHRARQRTSL